MRTLHLPARRAAGRVGGDSAASLIRQIREDEAVKALVLATGYLKNDGIDVVCVPEFVDVEIDDKVRTAIRMMVRNR